MLDAWALLNGRDRLATTAALVRGDEHTELAVIHAVTQRLGRESGEGDGVDDTNARAGEERSDSLSCHEQVHRDGVARLRILALLRPLHGLQSSTRQMSQIRAARSPTPSSARSAASPECSSRSASRRGWWRALCWSRSKMSSVKVSERRKLIACSGRFVVMAATASRKPSQCVRLGRASGFGKFECLGRGIRERNHRERGVVWSKVTTGKECVRP